MVLNLVVTFDDALGGFIAHRYSDPAQHNLTVCQLQISPPLVRVNRDDCIDECQSCWPA